MEIVPSSTMYSNWPYFIFKFLESAILNFITMVNPRLYRKETQGCTDGLWVIRITNEKFHPWTSRENKISTNSSIKILVKSLTQYHIIYRKVSSLGRELWNTEHTQMYIPTGQHLWTWSYITLHNYTQVKIHVKTISLSTIIFFECEIFTNEFAQTPQAYSLFLNIFFFQFTAKRSVWILNCWWILGGLCSYVNSN